MTDPGGDRHLTRWPAVTEFKPSGPPGFQLKTVNRMLALRRIGTMMRPGGVLRLRDLVFDFAPAQAEVVVDGWLDSAAEDPATGYTRDDFAEHLRTEFSTFRWLFEPMLAAAGFSIVTSDFENSIYGACTCVKA